MQDFWIKFIKHLVRRSWSPPQVKIWSEHDSKWPKDQTVKAENSEDLDRKCWSLRNKERYPNRGETDAKGPHVERVKVPEDTRSITDKGGSEPGWGGPRPVNLGRLTQPTSGPIRCPLWPRQPSGYYSSPAKSRVGIHSAFAAEEQRIEGHHSGEQRVEIVV
jgi:hypothetical protein